MLTRTGFAHTIRYMSNYRNEDNLDVVAAALKALSNPTRLRIFLRLVNCCGVGIDCKESELGSCVTDLGKGLDIAPSTLSHHVKELRHAGLLRQNRIGKEIYCCVDDRALRVIAEFVKGLEGILDGKEKQACGVEKDTVTF